MAKIKKAIVAYFFKKIKYAFCAMALCLNQLFHFEVRLLLHYHHL